MNRILVVDDEQNVLDGVRRVLSREKDFSLECFACAETALARLDNADFDLIMSDYQMPGMNGVDLLSRARERLPDCARIILSGMADRDALAQAINEAGVFRFIMKPVSKLELISTIRMALDHRALLLENKQLADEIRRQRCELERREEALEQFARNNPKLAEVNWDPDGSVIIGPGEY